MLVLSIADALALSLALTQAVPPTATPATAPPMPPASAPAAAAPPPPVARNAEDRLDRMQQEIEALRAQNNDQAQKIEALERAGGETWLTEQRASQIRGIVGDVLSDASTRSSLQGDGATAGYDKNFFMASADGNFRLNIEGQLQVTFAYSHLSQGALAGAASGRSQVGNEYGFQIQTMKLDFFGNVIDPSWTYRVQFASNRNGTVNGRSVNFEDIFIQKALGDGIFVRAGQWKNIFNYEEYVSSRTQLFVERSLVNQYFSTKFVEGAMVGWMGESTQAFGGYNDGGGNRDIQVVQPTGNPTQWAVTGRVQQKLAGAWNQFADMQGWRGSPFGALVGAGINWQRAGGVPPTNRAYPGNGALPPAAGTGTVNDQVTLLTYTADLNLRGDGWSVMAAFLGNYTYAGGAVANASGVNGALSYGTTIHGGYFVSDAIEVIARYEGLWVSSDNHNVTSGSALTAQTLNLVTAGFNYYFSKNDAKFTFDAGYSFEPLLFSNGLFGESVSGGDWRPSQTGQGGGEIVVRGQMQLLF